MPTSAPRVEEPRPAWGLPAADPRSGDAAPLTPPQPSSEPAQGVTRVQAVVSSKGQVTLPAAMRAQLGLTPGSHIHFELRGREIVIQPELPISAYYGILKGYDLGDIEPEKEPDREFD
ncbi:MAG: AbrB/MazE/SpoVT family DNA-binding domain-containing protein [Rubrivivax sp.]